MGVRFYQQIPYTGRKTMSMPIIFNPRGTKKFMGFFKGRNS
jgi:hypothetical protein